MLMFRAKQSSKKNTFCIGETESILCTARHLKDTRRLTGICVRRSAIQQNSHDRRSEVILFHHNTRLHLAKIVKTFSQDFGGLPAYMRQLSMVRLLAHVRYAHVKMNILKVYSDPVEAAVKVRWRVDALSGLRIVILLWKFNILKYRDFLNKKSDFTDGFSIFYVNSDGKIWKHVVDKMVPDEDRAVVDTEKDALAAKLSAALIVGWGGVQAVSDML